MIGLHHLAINTQKTRQPARHQASLGPIALRTCGPEAPCWRF